MRRFKRKRRFVWSFLILLLTGQMLGLRAIDPSPKFKWEVGEDLQYKVKWAFVTLGKLRFRVLETDTLNGRTVYHCRVNIDSNPSLPFVRIHDVYDSYMDAEDFASYIFISYEDKKTHTIYTRYDFDYERREVHILIQNQYPDSVVTLLDSVASIPGRVYDSLSMFFLARGMVKNKTRIDIPVFAYNKVGITHINFEGTRKKVNVRGQKLHAYYLDGRLKFVGIAGIKEGFKGWFSEDLQSVPVKAKMKAFVGSVDIILEDWEHWDGDSIFSKLEWANPGVAD